MDFLTKCVHGDDTQYDITGAVSVPIFQSATFAHPAFGESTGFDYSRLQNPTRERLEKTVAALEGGNDAMAFPSGMAAIAILLELFETGDHIIATDDLYGGAIRYFREISEKHGIRVDFVDSTDISLVEEKINPQTKALFIETPTNPMMKVTDIAASAALCKEHGLLLIVDNTFLTPYYQKPIALGADIVIHSGTKYLGGHNDTLAGFIVTSTVLLSERLRFIYKTVGACLGPLDSWLIIRGIKTLCVRMDASQKSAIAIAKWLTAQSKVNKVYYPGLAEHPEHELSKKQASGFGAMISFELDSEETALQVLAKLSVIQYAESLGGVESLITYPATQTHADVPEKERLAKGINEKLLRLSVGLEAVSDLIEDLDKALNT